MMGFDVSSDEYSDSNAAVAVNLATKYFYLAVARELKYSFLYNYKVQLPYD
jgi:hypothetical protein